MINYDHLLLLFQFFNSNKNQKFKKNYKIDRELCDVESTPPPSPPVRRHLRDENVFNRLASTNNYHSPDRLVIFGPLF